MKKMLFINDSKMKEANNNRKQIAKIILFSLVILFLVIKFVFFILATFFSIEIFFNKFDKFQTISLYDFFLITCLVLYLQFKLRKKLAKILSVAVAILILFHVLIYNYGGFFSSDSRFLYFNSPDNKTTLVVQQTPMLFVENNSFYVKLNSFFIRNLNQEIGISNGYSAFTKGTYNIKWIYKNSIKLTYETGIDNNKETKLIKW
ncbi:MAG: hypothetical protein WC677_03885 [Clostridia bacterium]|jgi:hypothetical protein